MALKQARFASSMASRAGAPYISAARFAYDNRESIARAARIIGKAGRKYLSKKQKLKKENFSPSNIGKDIGTADCKKARVVQEFGQGIIDTRTLYFFDLMKLEPGYFDQQREGAVVNVSGVKICSEWFNTNGGNQFGVNLNIAVISPKDSNAKGTALAIKTDFFNAMGGNGTNRAVDFSNSLSSTQFRCLPINTDKWVVLRHFREKVWANAPNTARGCYITKDFYVKLNRQIQWSSSAPDATADSPVFLVYWFDDFIDPAGSDPVVGILQHQIKAVLYFRDPK